MASLFTKTKDLVMKIDNFIDLTAESSLHFKNGLRQYLDNKDKEFEERLITIGKTESKADTLLGDIETQLYGQTLIPESRGDVLGILESMDNIIDSTKSTMVEFSVEKPEVPDSIKKHFLELVEPVVKTVESLTCATRAFFYEINAVKDHLQKVKFYEKEADRLAEKIKRDIFNLDIDLSRKLHLRYFIIQIDALADESEAIAGRIAIATIKRIV